MPMGTKELRYKMSGSQKKSFLQHPVFIAMSEVQNYGPSYSYD